MSSDNEKKLENDTGQDKGKSSGIDKRSAFWATVFGTTGVLHFAARPIYDTIIPEDLPGDPSYWTWGSGLMELGLAAAILHPTTRPKIGKVAAVFLVGVLPGNVKMARDWQENEKMSPILKAGAWGRVVAQAPMIASVAKIR